MNITLLGHEDIASLTALDTLIRLRPGHDYRVFWSGAMPPPATPAPTLDALATVDRRLFDRYLDRESTADLFRFAGPLSAPNSPAGLAALDAGEPDLVVSVRYRRILRDEAIAVPTHGVLNLHSGILPDYRGVMATFWAMLAGEQDIGTTLHWISDSGVDTGPIIGIQRQPVDYSASYLDNLLSLYPPGCAMLAAAIDAIEATGRVPSQLQSVDSGRYYGPPDEAAARRFTERGYLLAPPD